MKEVAAESTPCPEWYGDTEWNVSLWGTYAFAGNDGHAEIGNSFNFNRQFATFNLSEFFSSDRYLETDHAWGGGIDFKYFFYRYFGVGVEGYLLDAKRNTLDIDKHPADTRVEFPVEARSAGIVVRDNKTATAAIDKNWKRTERKELITSFDVGEHAIATGMAAVAGAGLQRLSRHDPRRRTGPYLAAQRHVNRLTKGALRPCGFPT